jgi:hypothetical protein
MEGSEVFYVCLPRRLILDVSVGQMMLAVVERGLERVSVQRNVVAGWHIDMR